MQLYAGTFGNCIFEAQVKYINVYLWSVAAVMVRADAARQAIATRGACQALPSVRGVVLLNGALELGHDMDRVGVRASAVLKRR